ncbi:MAG: hypothetical protein VST68_07890, partial [Nitrospirota bacterium]|nr:hypothetical protein [Nitrospirota bacterium]
MNDFLTWPIKFRGEIYISSRWEWSKKSVQQGRSSCGARSVLPVREHGTRARTPLAAFSNIPSMMAVRFPVLKALPCTVCPMIPAIFSLPSLH